MDDIVIQYCQNLSKKDLILKWEMVSSNRKAKREYLNDSLTKELILKLNEYFKMTVEVPRIMRGDRQEFETLINEETFVCKIFARRERNMDPENCSAFSNFSNNYKLPNARAKLFVFLS